MNIEIYDKENRIQKIETKKIGIKKKKKKKN